MAILKNCVQPFVIKQYQWRHVPLSGEFHFSYIPSTWPWDFLSSLLMLENMLTRYFPDGPGVKAPRCQNQGHGFHIWSRKLRSHVPCRAAKRF